MMSLLEWLLDPVRLREGGDGVRDFHFATAPARWIMLFGAVIAALIVYNLYRRETVAGWRRWALMLLRFGVIMTALLLFSRPTLTFHRSHVEPSVVAVLIDRSQSMAERDVDAPNRSPASRPSEAAAGRSRWEAAVERLAARPGGLLTSLLRVHRAEVWTVGEAAQRLAVLESADELPQVAQRLGDLQPVEEWSDLEGALADVQSRLSGQRLAGLVLVSDGRRNGGASGEPMGARDLPIVSVGVGSPAPRLDLAVATVWADERVFVFDAIDVRIHIALRGLAEPAELVLDVVPAGATEPVASRTVTAAAGDPEWRGSIRFKPSGPGRHRFRVGVRELPGERSIENNWAELEVDVQEAKVAVLYVEDGPRFEYRYLKNLMMRESGLDTSCLLLSATAGFVQEGTRPIERFPRSIEELGHYDVIVLGDVDPRSDWLSPAQEAMLVDFVANLGGGVAFLAGERNMPQKLRRTRLEKLLPVGIGPAGVVAANEALVETFVPSLTLDGRQSPLLRWFEDDAKNSDFYAQLPGWYWSAPVGPSRPGATVLMEHPRQTVSAGLGPTPLLVLGRYGAGRTLFIGSDDIWRWRQVGEEDAYHAFWLRAFRELARNRRLGPDRPLRIETDRREYALGQTVQVEVHGGQSDALNAPHELNLVVRDKDGATVERLTVRRRDSHALVGSFRAARLGALDIAADVLDRTALPPRSITVRAPDSEADQPESDPVYLRHLAEATGGAYFDLHQVPDDLIAHLPDRSGRIQDDTETPLWDTRLMLAVFLTLIVAEWIVRKYAGLP